MDLCDALRAALPKPEYEDLEDVLGSFPSIRELAELWSGQRSGRPYLSARRRFERYFVGAGKAKRGGQQARRLDEDDLEEFLDQFRERVQERRRKASGGAQVSIAGTVQVSKDTRRRRIHGELSGECVDRIIDLLDEDLCDEAAEAFEECFGEENDFGGQVPHWSDVAELSM